MNELTIKEYRKNIASLIQCKMLKEAFAQMEALLSQFPEWGMQNQLDHLKTSYDYMLQYMRQGVNDPQREKLYQGIVNEAYALSEQISFFALDLVSSTLLHTTRVDIQKSHDLSLDEISAHLESFPDEIAVAGLMSDENKLNVFRRHELMMKQLFLKTWGTAFWNAGEQEAANGMLTSELLLVNDLCFFVSAVTLSLMECFDERKVIWLLDAYQHQNGLVNQRALIGFMIACHIHATRLANYPELKHKIELMGEQKKFVDDLNRAYSLFLLAQETEKVDRLMRDEIIPEMIKGAQKINHVRFEADDTDDEDKEPDWMEALKNQKLDDKMMIINDLQMEGADVQMSTFSSLKGYSFFNELSKWFLVFDEHFSFLPDISKTLKDKNSILSIILLNGFFCNSDKFSLIFTLDRFPQSQREMMLSQMAGQDADMLKDESKKQLFNQYNDQLENICNQYLHDLYRFFKLFNRRIEFRDVFKEKLEFHHIPILDKLIAEPEHLLALVDFFFKKERWNEAVAVCSEILQKGGSTTLTADFYQKIGYTFQKLKKYNEAIEAYLKADMIKSDHIWTIWHLATCYRMIRNYESASSYYRKILEVNGEEKKAIYNLGLCLIELGRYEEALNIFFKFDFIANEPITAKRGIAWCSFMMGKYEQAMKYYKLIFDSQSEAIDYLNAGHVAFAFKQIDEAARYYERASDLYGSKMAFMEAFEKDEKILLKHDVSDTDMALMIDLL